MPDSATDQRTGRDVDVIIVGAGPIGLTLACALQHHGVSFRILEQKKGQSTDSKGHNLIARSQELLASIGVLDPLAKRAYRSPVVQILLEQRPFARTEDQGQGSPYNAALFSSQGAIEKVLSGVLADAGNHVEHGRQVTSFEEREGSVLVRVGDTPETEDDAGLPMEELRCRFLVGADGVKGLVRKTLGLDFEPEVMRNRATRQIDAKLSWRRSTNFDQAWFFLYPNGLAGVMPVWEGVYRLFFLEDEALVPQRDPTLEEMVRHAREVIGDETFTMTDPVWFSWGTFKHGVAPAFSKGRVYLAGDAGNTALPIGGQGMNTGLHDAVGLAWRLAMVLAGVGGQDILGSYGGERQGAHAALDKQQTKGFNQLMYHRGSAVDALAQGISGIVPNLTSKVFGGDDLDQLSLSYPDSSLSEDHFSSINPKRQGAPRAGARAPDARLTDAKGRDTTLFEQIYNPDGLSWGWRLLAFDGADRTSHTGLMKGLERVSHFPFIKPQMVIADVRTPKDNGEQHSQLYDFDELGHRAYDLAGTPALVLIRPDGHIAFRAPADLSKHLEAYCSRIFTGPGEGRQV